MNSVVGSSSVTTHGRAGRSFRRFVVALVLSAIVPITAGHGRLHAQAVPNEYRLKAAFVYQFPHFVEWPAAALKAAGTLQICVVQPNPFGGDLDSLVRGESVNGRPLAVKEVGVTDGVGDCHVLFVSSAAKGAGALIRA